MQAWTSGSFMNLRTSLHAHSPSSQARALIARISLVIGGEGRQGMQAANANFVTF